MPSRDALMLPDVLTEGDDLEMPPLPDASFLLSQMDDDSHLGRKRRAGSRDINLQEDLQSSQFLQDSIENRNNFGDEEDMLEDLDLGLDFGLDGDDMNSKNDLTMEFGRDAPTTRGAQDDLLSELDVHVPAKDSFSDDRDVSVNLGFRGEDDFGVVDDEMDVDMFTIGDGPDVSALPAAPVMERGRFSESPLSDIDETIVQQVETEQAQGNDTALYEPEEETEQSIFRNPPQRSRRQKQLHPDAITMISNTQIKEQQANRDKIIRPPSFLPRDPELLALMEMQKNGGFVSNIMGEGRSSTWAPELRGMLSLDAVRKTNDLKRKRDSGIADMDSDVEGPHKSPRLELGEDEEDLGAGLHDAGFGQEETAIAADGTILEIPGDDMFVINMEDDDHNASAGLVESPGPNFDETTAPLVHPADSGPVSLGTKHAVHLLRDRFGAEAANSPNKRKNASVLFRDLLPEETTSRTDATKMFFEILVLATKDAVKVEQQEALLGGPIRVRGKRGLWGEWAEREAGGEIEEDGAFPVGSTAITVAA
jgi:cohesin complex subunit SCC1